MHLSTVFALDIHILLITFYRKLRHRKPSRANYTLANCLLTTHILAICIVQTVSSQLTSSQTTPSQTTFLQISHIQSTLRITSFLANHSLTNHALADCPARAFFTDFNPIIRDRSCSSLLRESSQQPRLLFPHPS